MIYFNFIYDVNTGRSYTDRHTDETKHQEAKQPMYDVIHKAYKLLLFIRLTVTEENETFLSSRRICSQWVLKIWPMYEH